MTDDLPVPFNPSVHRPAALGYRKEAVKDRALKLGKALVVGLAGSLYDQVFD